MAGSPQNPVAKENGSPAPLPPSINKNEGSLSYALNRLSISTASSTALPPSSQPSSPSPRKLGHKTNTPSSPNARSSRSPLRRSSSVMSLDTRAASPTLHRKASMNSLHGLGGTSSARSPSRASPSRRSSSASFINASTLVGKTPLAGIEDVPEAPPPPTAASIASNHFKKELERDISDEEARPADTVVILHDSCYGHRFSRPRTSKASLSTIVERPERIHASILGLSVAYVRLGERHAEGQYPPHPKRDPSTVETAPFRIRKTTRRLPLTSQAVTNVHGVKWMEELKIMCLSAEAKLAMNGKELTRPEMSRSPDQGMPAKLHEGDLYLCSESLDAMEGALGAVCEGVDAVFQGSTNGKGPHRTFVAIRPPGHHCSASYPSGFCWLNNVHVGISHAALAHGLTHAAIIDFDLHHGDGSQAIAWEHNTRAISLPKNALPWKKTSIGYFSLHDINSYPCEMGDEEKVKNASLCIDNAHGQSIWNVHLQPWKTEAEFWELYETKYSILLTKTREYLRLQTERFRSMPNSPKPKAAIFLSAGFDASEWESSGMQRHKVNVPTEFYARLSKDVVKLAAEDGTSVDGRIISVLEGGYSDRALCSGVLSHISGLAGGDSTFIKTDVKNKGLNYEMGQKIGAFDSGDGFSEGPVAPGYDSAWWSLQQLDLLDAAVNPAPIPEPKKPKDGITTTYSSPTQSFIAKVTATKTQRSASNMSQPSNGSPRSIARPPTPPPPEVPWTIAAHELSKLLIPVDRQTKSCRPEDLSAEATRARRDRQPSMTPTGTPGPAQLDTPRMALRVRKPAKVLIENTEEDNKRPGLKNTRRKTAPGSAPQVEQKAPARSGAPKVEPGYTQATKQSTRRLSTASDAGSVMSAAPLPSNGHYRTPSSGLSSRPSTSSGPRPDSSTSSRGHSVPPIVMKKTRTPAQPRSDAPKAAPVRRKSPLADKGRVSLGNDGTMDVPPRTSSAMLPSKQPSSSKISDMDSLTNGMKKVKLSLTTKAQRDAKEQKKPASKSTAIMKTPAKKAATQPSTPTIAEPSSATTEPVSSPDPLSDNSLPRQPEPFAPSTPQPSLPPLFRTHIQEPAEVPLPPSTPVTRSQLASERTSSASSSGPDLFIPYQPEGPNQNTAVQNEPLRWLPPNTSTPASVIRRNDLPVFTSTSTIPFAPNPNLGQSPKKPSTTNTNTNTNTSAPLPSPSKSRDKSSVWEIPETLTNQER